MPRFKSLSFELLQTFVKLVENKGDAAETAEQLDINQPSMSKRLRYLQLRSPVLPSPWLVREGKTWNLTEECQKALPAVRDLIYRHEQLKIFVDESGRPDLTFACGRQSAVGFVREALRQYRREYPDSRVRISTLRGDARILGVANGSLDLATVTHDKAAIQEIARRDLHIEPIATDRLALVCAAKTPWAPRLEKLPKNKLPLSALGTFPLILPEPDAGIRKPLDDLLRKHGMMRTLDIRLELGGWSAIMAYVSDGSAVGVVSESSIPDSRGLVIRHFDPAVIPPTAINLICRRRFEDREEPALSPHATAFYEALKQAAANRKK